jgi:hypothetical protein
MLIPDLSDFEIKCGGHVPVRVHFGGRKFDFLGGFHAFLGAL